MTPPGPLLLAFFSRGGKGQDPSSSKQRPSAFFEIEDGTVAFQQQLQYIVKQKDFNYKRPVKFKWLISWLKSNPISKFHSWAADSRLLDLISPGNIRKAKPLNFSLEVFFFFFKSFLNRVQAPKLQKAKKETNFQKEDGIHYKTHKYET